MLPGRDQSNYTSLHHLYMLQAQDSNVDLKESKGEDRSLIYLHHLGFFLASFFYKA